MELVRVKRFSATFSPCNWDPWVLTTVRVLNQYVTILQNVNLPQAPLLQDTIERLITDSADGSDQFLRNFGSHVDYT
jgi:hypothetical protein